MSGSGAGCQRDLWTLRDAKRDAKIGEAVHLVWYKLVQLFGTIDLWLAWRLLSAQRPFGFIRPCGLINT